MIVPPTLPNSSEWSVLTLLSAACWEVWLHVDVALNVLKGVAAESFGRYSYGFVVNRNGETLVHPSLPQPDEVTVSSSAFLCLISTKLLLPIYIKVNEKFCVLLIHSQSMFM
jgi:hypothetical protein